MIVRQLAASDWKQWKDIRLEALKTSPESFASSYEEELAWQDSEFKDGLSKNQIFGVFINDAIVSCGGFYCLNELKTKHRGVIWGMYTRPEYRGKGFATTLLSNIIQQAKTSVIQLHLTCVTSNLPAVAFYQKQGFTIYGTEPRALQINDIFFDEYLMILDLNEL